MLVWPVARSLRLLGKGYAGRETVTRGFARLDWREVEDRQRASAGDYRTICARKQAAVALKNFVAHTGFEARSRLCMGCKSGVNTR